MLQGININILTGHYPRYDIQNILFVVNDVSIPWHWYYNTDTKKFLIEDYACGTIFVENIERSAEEYEEWIKSYARHRDFEKTEGSDDVKYTAIIIGGFYKEKYLLPYLLNEVKEITKLFRENSIFSFGDKEVVVIRKIRKGSSHYKELKDTLLSSLSTIGGEVVFAEKVKFIHYAGHIEGGKRLSPGTTPPIDAGILKGPGYQITFCSEPLVFLNGCSSGKIENFWNKAAQLSTAFLDAHASVCIVTSYPIPDEISYEIAKKFYQEILKEGPPYSYGQALKEAREYYQSEINPSGLFFIFMETRGLKL